MARVSSHRWQPVAGVQDELGEGSGHRALHSRVGSAARPERPLTTARRPWSRNEPLDWTSRRSAPDDACRRRDVPAGHREGWGAMAVSERDAGTDGARSAIRVRPGRRFLAFV